MDKIKLVAGNSNRPLAEAVGAYLQQPLAKCQVRRFADMEIFVEIQENVRGEDVFVLQSTSFPTNDHLMGLLIIIDALRRSSARRITAVVPYFGYARQDRKSAPRTPISAKLVANLMTEAGADRVLTLDLHAAQIQGFFDVPVDNLFGAPVMVQDIKARFEPGKVMVVSPDVGGVVRARALANRINAPLAIVDKRRPRAGESEVMNIIGDVTGYSCILVDDIVDSGGTLCNAADALMAVELQRGEGQDAARVVGCGPHRARLVHPQRAAAGLALAHALEAQVELGQVQDIVQRQPRRRQAARPVGLHQRPHDLLHELIHPAGSGFEEFDEFGLLFGELHEVFRSG